MGTQPHADIPQSIPVRANFTLTRVNPMNADSAFELYTGVGVDSEMFRYLQWTPHPSPTDTKHYFEYLQSQETAEQGIFRTLIIDQQCAGMVSLLPRLVPGGNGQVPSSNSPDALELGYALSPQFWHKGYARDAIHALLSFLPTTTEPRTVWATTHPENSASQRLLARNGFTLEGHVPSGQYPNLPESQQPTESPLYTKILESP